MADKRECGNTPSVLDEDSPVPVVVICTPGAIGRYVELMRSEEYLDVNEVDIYIKDVGELDSIDWGLQNAWKNL